MWGVDLLPAGERDVEITVPREPPVLRHSGVHARRALLPPSDTVIMDGMRVTSELRTALDLARRGPRDDAVIAAAAHLALAADRAESPMETRLRLVLLDGGLPAPVVNESLCDAAGRFLARPDLRIGRVLIEYDGAVHRSAQRHRDDLRRQNALIQAGYVVLRYTATDVYQRPAAIVAEVRVALQS